MPPGQLRSSLFLVLALIADESGPAVRRGRAHLLTKADRVREGNMMTPDLATHGRSEECSAGETPSSFRDYATALGAMVATGEPRAAERLANTFLARLEQFAHMVDPAAIGGRIDRAGPHPAPIPGRTSHVFGNRFHSRSGRRLIGTRFLGSGDHPAMEGPDGHNRHNRPLARPAGLVTDPRRPGPVPRHRTGARGESGSPPVI